MEQFKFITGSVKHTQDILNEFEKDYYVKVHNMVALEKEYIIILIQLIDKMECNINE